MDIGPAHHLASLDEAYNRRSWHGTNLRGSVIRVTAAQALWRPGPGRLNIWELTLHCAYQKYVVRRRLTGERRGSFPMKGSNFFPSPPVAADAEWKNVLKLMDDQHRLLREAVAALPATLTRAEPAARLLRGIAAHDLYHAGQIQLLKRLSKG